MEIGRFTTEEGRIGNILPFLENITDNEQNYVRQYQGLPGLGGGSSIDVRGEQP